MIAQKFLVPHVMIVFRCLGNNAERRELLAWIAAEPMRAGENLTEGQVNEVAEQLLPLIRAALGEESDFFNSDLHPLGR